MSETGGGGEGTSWRNRVNKILGRSPEKRELTPEQKAQQAFLELSDTSAASEEGLTPIRTLEEPSIFDVNTEPDLSVFRVIHEIHVNTEVAAQAPEGFYEGKAPIYFVIVDGQERTMYIPKIPMTHGREFSFESDDEVVGFPLKRDQSTILNWDKPWELFPPEMFVQGTYNRREQRTLNVHELDKESPISVRSVEWVSGGDKVKQKSPTTAPDISPAPSIVPKPQMG